MMLSILNDISVNRMLIAGLAAWFLAQFLKVPIDWMVNRRFIWTLWFSPGGMPSSHSALMTGTTTAIGLYTGFNTATFALAFAITMVVIYDAAGVRRQAGLHAQKLNLLINELLSGHPISEQRLKEVLGHTPREVVGGISLGIIVPVFIWAIWH
ncbi:MAG: divergent PAP2 family protein [Chloroflexi bacterium]|nr:divergent PAP2 family protein [Anaerolineaceae bacterium]NMB89210.1 divergent PAP2 family protein [Chloroflexota bacterium]